MTHIKITESREKNYVPIVGNLVLDHEAHRIKYIEHIGLDKMSLTKGFCSNLKHLRHIVFTFVNDVIWESLDFTYY